MTNLFLGIFGSFLFFCLLLLIEIVTKKHHYNSEYTRKVAHVLSGLFAITMALILLPRLFISLTIVFIIIISLSYLTHFFSSIHNVQRKTIGELLFPLGILTTYLISNGASPRYVASLLIITLADPLAGIIGISKGREKKTFTGSVFFLLSTCLILFLVYQKVSLSLLIIALLLTFLEHYTTYGTDNFFVPVICSMLLLPF